MSQPSFSSLPADIVWNIFARVPKRSYPILACVSKNFRHLVRSQEIQKIRSCLGKDSLYICFSADRTNNRKWFTLRRAENNEEGENQFVSVDLVFSCHYKCFRSTIVAIGPEIFFICGSSLPSSCMWIFDSRTGKLRRGPSSKVDRLIHVVGLVGSKMYVMGRYPDDEIHVESFDLKTQTWEMAPDPERLMYSLYETVSLDKKICTLPLSNYSELRLWRPVNGLNHLNKVRSVGMAEYYGKLAFLWTELGGDSGETKEIWCRMIALERSEVGVHGTPEASQFLESIPRGYMFEHCLSLSE